MSLPMAQMFLAQQAPQMPPLRLPPLQQITPYLAPAAAMVWVDADGFHGRAVSPFSGAMMFSPDGLSSIAGAGAAAAIAISGILNSSLAVSGQTRSAVPVVPNGSP